MIANVAQYKEARSAEVGLDRRRKIMVFVKLGCVGEFVAAVKRVGIVCVQ